MPVAQLGDRQRGPLALGEQIAGFPRREQRQPLLGFAALAGVGGVHVQTKRAVVELRLPDSTEQEVLRRAGEAGLKLPGWPSRP